MPTTFRAAVERYLRAKPLSPATRCEYRSTVRKWAEWGSGALLDDLSRGDVRDFLDWVYARAVEDQGTNPGRTANKAREHLRAVLSWAWEQELIQARRGSASSPNCRRTSVPRRCRSWCGCQWCSFRHRSTAVHPTVPSRSRHCASGSARSLPCSSRTFPRASSGGRGNAIRQARATHRP